MQCNKDLVDCDCADFQQRMDELKGHPNLDSSMLAKIESLRAIRLGKHIEIEAYFQEAIKAIFGNHMIAQDQLSTMRMIFINGVQFGYATTVYVASSHKDNEECDRRVIQWSEDITKYFNEKC